MNKVRRMDPERRQQIMDAVEAWSQEHWAQRWARAMEIVEESAEESGAATYHVGVELSDNPDWMLVLVRVAPDGQMTIEERPPE